MGDLLPGALNSIAEHLWPLRKVYVSAQLNESDLWNSHSFLVVLQDVCIVMGCIIFYQIGREFMEFGRRGGRSVFGENKLSTVRSHQRYIGFVSSVGQLKNVCFATNEIQVFVQEWSKDICYLFDYANFYFNLPSTSLSYQQSWWSQALLFYLKSFWDAYANWFWWTEGQVWILDHLHTTVNSTSFVKSSYISRCICETSKFPNFEDEVYEELSILPSSHPCRLFWPQANAAPKPASRWLMLACKCSSFPRLEIDMFFTSWSIEDNDLIKLQEDEWGIVKRDGATSPKLHLHSQRKLGNGTDNPEAGESRKPTRWRTPAMQRHYADVNLTNSDIVFVWEKW